MIEVVKPTQTLDAEAPPGWRVEHSAPGLEDRQVERLVKLAVQGRQAFALKAAADRVLGVGVQRWSKASIARDFLA